MNSLFFEDFDIEKTDSLCASLTLPLVINCAQPFPTNCIDGVGGVDVALQNEHDSRSHTNTRSRQGCVVSSIDGNLGSMKDTICPFEKGRTAANEFRGVTLCFTRQTATPGHPSARTWPRLSLTDDDSHGNSTGHTSCGTNAGWTLT